MTEIRRNQTQRRAATRAAILTAARALFAEHGYHACSIDTILARAESSKGAFYHHFRDKAAVLEALLAEFEEGVRRSTEWSVGRHLAAGNHQDFRTQPAGLVH